MHAENDIILHRAVPYRREKTLPRLHGMRIRKLFNYAFPGGEGFHFKDSDDACIAIDRDVERWAVPVIEDIEQEFGSTETVVGLRVEQSAAVEGLVGRLEPLHEPTRLRSVPPRPPHRDGGAGERYGGTCPGSENFCVHEQPPSKHSSVRRRFQRRRTAS